MKFYSDRESPVKAFYGRSLKRFFGEARPIQIELGESETGPDRGVQRGVQKRTAFPTDENFGFQPLVLRSVFGGGC